MAKQAQISKNQLAVIKREWKKRSIPELAKQLNLKESDVKRIVDSLSRQGKQAGIEPKAKSRNKEKRKQIPAEPVGKVISFPGWRQIVAVALLTAVFLGAIYANTWKVPFTLDDRHSIVKNMAIRNAGNISSFFTDPQTFSSLPGRRMFRPLLLVSYWVNYAVFGFDNAGWHAFNLLFHFIGVMLVMGIVYMLTGHRWAALVTGLIFAVHPVNTEVVNYVSSRSSTLAGICFFAGFLLHRIWRQKPDAIKYRWGSVAAYGIGLLVKENVIVLPVIMWISDRLIDRSEEEKISEDVRRYAPFIIVGFFYLIIRRAALGLDTVVITTPVRGYASNILTQISVLCYNLRTILWPNNLNSFHSYPVFSGLGKFGAPVLQWPFVSILILAGMGYLIRQSRNALIQFGGLWYVISLLPETMIPLNQVVTERRLYVPMVGILLIVSAGMLRMIRSDSIKYRKAIPVLSAALIGLFIVLVVARNKLWANEVDLWRDSVRKDPFSSDAHHSLGYVFEQQGNIQKALKEWELALNLNPNNPDLLRNLAVAYNRTNKTEEAIEFLNRSLQLEPNSPNAYYNLGEIYAKMGQMDEAERVLRKAIEISPTYTTPYNNLALILIQKGQFEEARKMLEYTLSIDPNQPVAKANLNQLNREHPE